MALFKNTAEIKDFLPVSTTFGFTEILPFLSQVERDYIIPVISKAQYDDLHTAYSAATPTLTSAQTALLAKIRVPLASFAFMLWIPYGQTKIDSSGIRIVISEHLKTAFQWQIEDLKGSANRSGYSGIEDLLEFLETGKATYTLWAASSAYTDFKKHFIRSAKEFQQYFNINSSRMTYLAVLPIMNRIEETLIKRMLGTDLYNEIKVQLKAGSVTADNQELVNLICPAVANLTISRAISELSVKIDEFGISIVTSSQSVKSYSKASDTNLSQLQRNTQDDADAYLKSLEEILNEDDDDYEPGPVENDPDWGVGMF